MIIEYECPSGHLTELIRKWADRDKYVICYCLATAKRIEISHSHVPPSGMYSYEPNLGSARDFERRRNALETGQRVIKREVGDG